MRAWRRRRWASRRLGGLAEAVVVMDGGQVEGLSALRVVMGYGGAWIRVWLFVSALLGVFGRVAFAV